MIMLFVVTGWPDKSVMVPTMYDEPHGLIGDGCKVILAV
jgi:hypothetical protein